VTDFEVQTHNRFHSQSIIEQLRYWVPAVNDVARVYEVDDLDGWRLFVIPAVPGACAVEVLLRKDGLFDIEVAGERYEECVLSSRDMLVQLLESIAAGRIVQQHLVSRTTGASHGVATIIPYGEGVIWRRGDSDLGADEVMARVDRHFLPYRR
jgi:hypothetical protein